MKENKNAKRILYCIHINWGWIKQRPQFLAEGLNIHFQIDVLSRWTWHKEANTNETAINMLFPFRLPFERFKIISWLNSFFRHRYLRSIINNYDYIWFTAPSNDSAYLLSIIDNNIKVIYDCMDDLLEFPNSIQKSNTLFEAEKKLFDRSNLIICSSNYLKGKLLKRYGTKKIVVVNNALAMNCTMKETDVLPPNTSSFLKTPNIRIVYIGTISEWFDVELCRNIVKVFRNVEFFLFGPCNSEMYSKFDFSGINICGSVDHKYVNSIMAHSDILIMPFVITELVQSVNPVKLYEYIKSGKPCIAPRYGESESFGDYVYLYNDANECINIVSSLISGKNGAKMPKEECVKYAEQNTWEKRIDVIKKEIIDLS